MEKKPRNGGTNGTLRHAKREKMSSHFPLESVDRAEVFDLIPTVIVVMDTNHTILDLNETGSGPQANARKTVSEPSSGTCLTIQNAGQVPARRRMRCGQAKSAKVRLCPRFKAKRCQYRSARLHASTREEEL